MLYPSPFCTHHRRRSSVSSHFSIEIRLKSHIFIITDLSSMSSKSGHQSSRLTPAPILCYPMVFTSLGFIFGYFPLFSFTFSLSYFCLFSSVRMYCNVISSFLLLLVTFSSAPYTNSKIRFLWYLVLLYFKSSTLSHLCYLT